MLTAPVLTRSAMFLQNDPSLNRRISAAGCPTGPPGGVKSIWTPQSVGQAEGPVVAGACPDPKPPGPALTTAELWGIGVGAFCAVALLVLFAVLLWRFLPQHRAARRLRGPPDPASADTTYAMTDIQDSTKLWESLPAEAMGSSVRLHFDCLRAALKECHGYLSYTEGDALFAAFHSVQDAVRWALLAQERLLDLAWPAELLAHPSAGEAHGEAASGEGGRALLYRGLRVRIGIHRGEAEVADRNRASAKMVYCGTGPSLCQTVCDAGEGGAVLVTGSSLVECSTPVDAAPFHCGVSGCHQWHGSGPGCLSGRVNARSESLGGAGGD